MGPLFDLRDLRAFLAVADEEHLGRAAERLHVSASPLSRHMIALEARLGLRLFERSRKRLRLTSEGRLFREQANALLAHAADIERFVSSSAAGEAGQIDIGYVPGAMWSGFLPGLIRRARQEMPGLSFRLHAMRSGEGIQALGRRVLDVTFAHTTAEIAGESPLSRALVHRDPFCVVVPDTHRLANSRDVLSAAALAREAWIALDSALSPGFRRRFLAACGACGLVPDIRYEAPDIPAVLGLIEAGLGVAVLQSAVKRMTPAGLVFIPWPEFPLDVRLHVQWRKDDPSPTLKRFLGIVIAPA